MMPLGIGRLSGRALSLKSFGHDSPVNRFIPDGGGFTSETCFGGKGTGISGTGIFRFALSLLLFNQDVMQP